MVLAVTCSLFVKRLPSVTAVTTHAAAPIERVQIAAGFSLPMIHHVVRCPVRAFEWLHAGGFDFEVDQTAPQLWQPRLAGPPATFLRPSHQVEQLVSSGRGRLVKTQPRRNVLDLEPTVAGLDPTDLAG